MALHQDIHHHQVFPHTENVQEGTGLHVFQNYTTQSIHKFSAALGDSYNSTKIFYNYVSSLADPRVEEWPLVSNPALVLAIFAGYLFMANRGPVLMKPYKPMELRWPLIAYNLYIAALNLWIACEICYCSYKLNYRSLCQLVVIDKNPYLMRNANAIWWYFISKAFEFTDTLFFVLRKKDRQLTFLHKYHHSSMFLIWWTAIRFIPGGSTVIPIVFNSLVHVIMYTYYGLSAIGPSMQKYLWWKKYLTMIQLIQFCIGISIGIRMAQTSCQFTPWMAKLFSAYTFSFIILFGNFYINEYVKTNKPIKADKTE